MIPYLLFTAVVFPAIMAFILYPIGKRYSKAAGLISVLVLLVSAVILASYLPNFLQGGNSIYESYNWIPAFNVSFGFLLDGLSFPIALIIAVLCILVAVYSLEYMKGVENQVGYYTCFILFYTGMQGVILASNLLEFYFFWELMIVPSYFLIIFWGTADKASKVGFKYFIYTHVGSLFLLLGIFLTYNYTHTFSLLTLQTGLAETLMPSLILKLAVFFMMISFMVKMAIFPFYTWLPDAHSEAPTPISSLLSGVMIACGAYAMVRIAVGCFPQTFTSYSLLFAIIGVITMIYGGLMAIVQTDIKRLLAYSSISQFGYIFFGFAVYTNLGLVGGLFQIITHAMAKGLLFMVAGIIMHQTGTRNIKELGGLAGKMPITATAATIGLLSLAGTPPFCGFVSEFSIFYGGLTAGGLYTILTAFFLVSMVITAAYCLLFIWRVFLGPTPSNLKDVKESSPIMWIPVVVLAVMTVLLGVMPNPLMKILIPTASKLIG